MTKASPTIAVNRKSDLDLYSFGIEEEYFVTKLATRNTCDRTPPGWIEACERARPGVYQRELLQSQIEAATPPLTDFSEARTLLHDYRATLSDLGRAHGVGIVAASICDCSSSRW